MLAGELSEKSAAHPSALGALPPFAADYAPPDETLVPKLLAETAHAPALDARIAKRARRYVTAEPDTAVNQTDCGSPALRRPSSQRCRMASLA
jgi:hypothetical protein